MRHAGTQTIETERLLLRPLTPEDASMMYANWANDPDVTRWLRWEPHKNVDETWELLAYWALPPQWRLLRVGCGKRPLTACWYHRRVHIQFR